MSSFRFADARTLARRSALFPVQVLLNLFLAPIVLARWKSAHTRNRRS